MSVREDSSGATKPQHTLPSAEPSTADLVTQKMTLKFARNAEKAADQDIAKRTFYLQVGGWVGGWVGGGRERGGMGG